MWRWLPCPTYSTCCKLLCELPSLLLTGYAVGRAFLGAIRSPLPLFGFPFTPRPPWTRGFLPPPRLVGRDDTRTLPHARRLSEVLQRGAIEGEAGPNEPDAVPQEPRAGGIAGPKKRPHLLTSSAATRIPPQPGCARRS